MRGRLPSPVGAFDFVPPQVVEAAKRLFSHLKHDGVVGLVLRENVVARVARRLSWTPVGTRIGR